MKGEKVHPVSIRKNVFGSYYSLTKEMYVHDPVLRLFLAECEGNTSIQTVTAGGFQHWCETTCFWTNGHMKMCCNCTPLQRKATIDIRGMRMRTADWINEKLSSFY